MRRTTLAVAALVACGALTLSACGSPDGPTSGSAGSGSSSPAPATSPSAVAQSNANLSHTELVNRLKTALASATAVHVKIPTGDPDGTSAIDMQLNADGSAQGALNLGSGPIPVMITGGTGYMQANAAYLDARKSSPGFSELGSAESLTGKWIKGDPMSTSLGAWTDWSRLTSEIGQASGETYTYLKTGTLNGQQVAEYTHVSTDESGKKGTDVASFPLNGPTLPIQLTSKTADGNTVTYVWNQPTKVSAPPAADIVTLPNS